MAKRCLVKSHDRVLIHLMMGELQMAGIVAELRGQHLAGLFGAIPWPDTRQSSWVDAARFDAAEAILKAHQGPQLAHPPWVCATCGETNEANFDTCWNCLTPLED